MMKPTIEFYDLFQFCYEYFNKELFNDELPNCMIVITRKNSVFGYYSKERWVNSDSQLTDEIAINPIYFTQFPLIEMFSTLCHEMCHLWQEHFGKPSKRTYHNKEWGAKMQSIGLMPSNTGKEGGKTTGQQMMEYPIEGGLFLEKCHKLAKDKRFASLWYDRTITPKIFEQAENLGNKYEMTITNEIEDDFLFTRFENAEEIVVQNTAVSKQKYTCINCHINVWGKPNLNIVCGECGSVFEVF